MVLVVRWRAAGGSAGAEVARGRRGSRIRSLSPLGCKGVGAATGTAGTGRDTLARGRSTTAAK